MLSSAQYTLLRLRYAIEIPGPSTSRGVCQCLCANSSSSDLCQRVSVSVSMKALLWLASTLPLLQYLPNNIKPIPVHTHLISPAFSIYPPQYPVMPPLAHELALYAIFFPQSPPLSRQNSPDSLRALSGLNPFTDIYSKAPVSFAEAVLTFPS